MLNVLLDHSDFVVLNKPPSITMHRSSNSPNPALYNCSDIPIDWHLVHRLDDETSGCLILAKHPEAAALFDNLFSTKSIQKTYLALSTGKGKRKMGWVKGDMYNRRDGLWLLKDSQNNPAISYFVRKPGPPGTKAFWVQPYTGKTHQIRAALKSNGASILGDTHYGGEDSDRMYLHAYAVAFSWRGVEYNITAPMHYGNQFLVMDNTFWQQQFEEVAKLWPKRVK